MRKKAISTMAAAVIIIVIVIVAVVAVYYVTRPAPPPPTITISVSRLLLFIVFSVFMILNPPYNFDQDLMGRLKFHS